MYIAIDPGKGETDSIGVAEFSNEGKLLKMSQCTFFQFINLLEDITFSLVPIKKVICEDYRIFKRKAMAHTGSRVETAQTIGAIRSWAVRNNVEIVYQRSDILPGAEKLFQVKMPKDHTQSHKYSAMLHGMHYLYGQGLIKSALEIEIENEKR